MSLHSAAPTAVVAEDEETLRHELMDRLAQLWPELVIVGEPNPLAAAIHDRMPVILEPDDYDRWLDPDVPLDELRPLLKSYPAERMKALNGKRKLVRLLPTEAAIKRWIEAAKKLDQKIKY